MSQDVSYRFVLLSRPFLALVVLGAGTTALGCSSLKRTTPVTEAVAEGVVQSSGVADERTPRSAAPVPEVAPIAPAEPSIVGHASGPARQILETAEQMLDDYVVVRGSCYDYIATIFDRAGFEDRRAREVIFQGPRGGPYADLDLVSPGDWLYIVAYPEARPVGTHSVLFVRWDDREVGQALVVSYVGGRADRSADLITRDVSRIYAIQRARSRQ